MRLKNLSLISLALLVLLGSSSAMVGLPPFSTFRVFEDSSHSPVGTWMRDCYGDLYTSGDQDGTYAYVEYVSCGTSAPWICDNSGASIDYSGANPTCYLAGSHSQCLDVPSEDEVDVSYCWATPAYP